jgi:hypothetical protein
MNPAEIQTQVTAALTAAFAGKPVFAWTGENYKDIQDALALHGITIVVDRATFGKPIDQVKESCAVEFYFEVTIEAKPESTDDVDANLLTAIRTVIAIADDPIRGRKDYRLDKERPFVYIAPEKGSKGWIINFTKTTMI